MSPDSRGHWAHRWSDYQSIFRVHERLVLALFALAAIGLIMSPSRTARLTIALLLASALALYLVPPLVALWDVRYGVLPGELLVTGATLGAWCGWSSRGQTQAGPRQRLGHLGRDRLQS